MQRVFRTFITRVVPVMLAGVSTTAMAATTDTDSGASAAAPSAVTADAAAAADGAASGLGEIIVTAQKRPENLQQTPIAISVLGADDLTNRHAQSLLDLGDGAVPSLRIAPFFSRPSALIINVRGVGVLSDSNQPARDQGVGIYIDGVYLGRAQGLGSALFDVANIEVLKGPQGTLFGRNTEGGAVNIVTKRPSGEYKVNATVGAGNYGSYKGEVHVDLPEFANLSVKLDGIVSHRGGMVKNPLAGASDFNAYDKRGIHGEVLWKPAPNFSADLSYDASYDATTTLYLQLISPGTGLAATATAPALAPNKLAAIGPVQPTRASTAVVGSPEQPGIGNTHGVRLGLDWHIAPQVTLKSITSYRTLRQSQFDNGNAVPSLQQPLTTANPTGSFVGFAFSRYSLAKFKQHQFSQELQAVGELDRLQFAFGALYYQEKVSDNAQTVNTNVFADAAGIGYTLRNYNLDTQPLDRASHVKTTSIGAYGQATYTPPLLDDAIHLTAGGRYTHDKKEGALDIVNGAAPILPVNGTNVVGPIPLNASWSRFDPMVNLAIDASRDIHFYGKWSTGYKSGGANSRSLSYQTFNPETVSMFEIGAKTEFWNRRARLNVAAYTGRYKDIQLDFSGLYEDVINGVRVATTRTTTNTVNAPGTGRLKGIEAEFTLAPVTGLTLTASYAYNSVKIPNTLNPFPQTGGVFITVPVPIYQVYTPKYAASGSIDYEIPGNGFTFRGHFDGNYDSGYYANYTDTTYDPVTRAVRFAQPKGEHGLVFNGRLAIADIDMGGTGAKLTVAVWARNLTNEQHLFYKSGSPTSGVTGFYNDFRTFGVEANIKM
ncbi:TonB-dependent receptor [Novosphingobium lentum]|uniref:TonB-dependent receptor n=1 Tax=Novosphingobium lentum TaxID=145287 RepID=UPI000829C065|nr:TonB-dependent receptor [Novosphingobium lentum]